MYMKKNKNKHLKNYADYFDIGICDPIVCEYCQMNVASDIHHIRFRGQGGGDEIENLIGICRKCHSMAHTSKISADALRTVHLRNMKAHKDKWS